MISSGSDWPLKLSIFSISKTYICESLHEEGLPPASWRHLLTGWNILDLVEASVVLCIWKFGHLWDVLLHSKDLICNDSYYLIELTNTEAAILCDLHKIVNVLCDVIALNEFSKGLNLPRTPHSSFLNCTFKNVLFWNCLKAKRF